MQNVFVWGFVVASLVFSTATASLSFTVEPSDAVVSIGQSLTLNCQATDSSGGTVRINWKKDSHWLVDPTNKPWRQLHNNSLYYQSISAQDIGVFKCGAIATGSNIKYSRTANVQLAYISAVFSSSPINRTKRVGNLETHFACVTGDSLPFATVYWEKDGKRLTGYQTTSMLISGPNPNVKWTSSSLSVRNISFASAGFYSCVAVNPLLPSKPKKSDAAYLHILPAFNRPHFQVQPSNAIIAEHQPGILKCIILGVPPPQVSWTFNEKSLQNTTARHMLSNGTLYFKSANRSMAGGYVCSGTNSAGSITSSPVFLAVAYFDFVFFKHPSSKNVSEGRTVSLRCEPPISYPVDVTITWYKSYQPVQAGSGITISSHGTLTFTAIRKADEGQYFCNGFNKVLKASRTSEVAKITVWVLPTFQVRPQNQTVIQYQSLLLDCRATGYPIPTVAWLKESKAVNTSHVITHTNGSLTILRAVYTGKYSCVATNVAGSTSATAVVTVHVPPTVSRSPVNATRIVGESQTFECTFQGFPLPSIDWYHNGSPTLLVPPNYVITGSTLKIKAVVKKDEGTYVCKGRNQAGVAAASAYLYIKVPVSLDAGPVNITVNASSSASFQCSASGDPKPSVTWFKGHLVLTHGGRIVIGENTLTVLQTKASDSGEYRCNVTNGLATHIGSAHLTVQVAPNITKFEVRTFAQLNGSTSMTCTVSGIPPPRITWYNGNDVVTSEGSRVVLLSNGSLRIVGVTKADGGTYACVVNNAAGKTARRGNLTIQVPPDPPVSLSAISLSSTSVKLSWQQGFNGYSGITGYKVEKMEGQLFTDIADNVVKTSYVIDALKPYTSYTFKLRARNVIGLSAGATVSNRTMEDAPTEPTSIIVTSLNSTAISVTWSAPTVPNGVVTWYKISYQAKQGIAVVREIPVRSLPNLVAVFDDLFPYTGYAVRVRAATGLKNWGNYSVEVVRRTGEAAPSVPPGDVRLTALNSSSLEVSWKPVPVASANGIVRRYRVSYQAVGPYHFSDVNVILAFSNSTGIHGLQSWTDYTISVQAVTVRPGPTSTWKVVRTREATPSGPPVNITLTSLSENSILVTMTEPHPRMRNGNITGYKIYYKNAKSPGPFSQWVITDSRQARLDNLTAYTEYAVYVSAITSAGEGVKSEKQRERTEEGVPGEVTDVTSLEISDTHVIITWSPPRPSTGVITHYKVMFKSSGNESYSKTTTTTTVTLSNLDPNTTYTIWVVARTTKGYGSAGKPFSIKTSPSPPPTPSLPSTSTTPQPNTTEPAPTVLEPKDPQTKLLSDRDMIIVLVCVSVIALVIIVMVVYFIVLRPRLSSMANMSDRSKKRRQGAVDMEMRGDSLDKRPVLDVQEEVSVGDSAESFDGSEWTSTITGMPSDPVSDPAPIVIALPGNNTPVLQPVTGSSQKPFTRPLNSANQYVGNTGNNDRSPLTRLRNKKLSLESTDSLYDQPYASVDELGTGFSSFTPPPPPDFRTDDTLAEPEPSPVDRRSFTNKLYKAVNDNYVTLKDFMNPEEKHAELSDQGFSETEVKSDGIPEVYPPAPLIPPDVEGFANEGYDTDEELDKYLKTARDYEPVKETKEQEEAVQSRSASTGSPRSSSANSSKSSPVARDVYGASSLVHRDVSGASSPVPRDVSGTNSPVTRDVSGTNSPVPRDVSGATSPVPGDVSGTNSPRAQGTGSPQSTCASSPADSNRGSPESDLYAKVDFKKKKKKKKLSSSEGNHEAVVVYDERTNL